MDNGFKLANVVPGIGTESIAEKIHVRSISLGLCYARLLQPASYLANIHYTHPYDFHILVANNANDTNPDLVNILYRYVRITKFNPY